MKPNSIGYKSIAILCVLLLIFSFNLTSNVTADPQNDQDGVYFDDFENENYVTLKDCNLSNGVILLREGTPYVIYDQIREPGNIEAWKIEKAKINIEGGGLSGFLGQYVGPDSLLLDRNEFSDAEYSKLEYEDGEVVVVSTKKSDQYDYYPMKQFRFKTDYNSDVVKGLELFWSFGPYQGDSYNLEKISMYSWNYNLLLPKWDHVKSIDYPWPFHETLNGQIGEFESYDYINDDGYVDILVIGTPEVKDDPASLATDYVNLIVTLKEGYYPKGSVTSNVIDPVNIYGWENIIWTGSRPSTYTNIKIRVLDENENVIQSLDGNDNGFTTSPIDISSLNTGAYSKIRLRANFTSTSLPYTPRLYNWGVMWQTKSNGFRDSFSNTYRIDESHGVKFEGGDVIISDFYSDWEIFGKNPANTRSYIGPLAQKGTNKTYWFSERLSNIGGGFRSPIVSDGVVYVASEDKRIYAFNLTADSDTPLTIPQYPFASSSTGYQVESSVAIGDGVVVFGTSILNSQDNKVYALNTSDLNDRWEYPRDGYSFDEAICFSAAPTIANDRVFITSSNGNFANNPFFTHIYNKINNFLKGIPLLNLQLFNTNKLYVLELSSGEPIWNPVTLPASSYSSPAVDNGLVFVGCDNIDGPSLLAYDENSGLLVWNATVGLAGRSSPIVGEINNEKAVFIIGREKTMTSFKGTDSVYAFNAETGSLLWNVTIDDNTSSSIWAYLKGYGFSNLAVLGSPISTPAYHEGTLYVLSQEGLLYALNVNNGGEEKWTFDINKGASLIGGFFPTFHVSSPIVVDNVVYIVNENSYVFALDTINSGNLKWEHRIYNPEYWEDEAPRNLLFSSPVIVDGLLVASTIEKDSDTDEFLGMVYVIGDYTENLEGSITSIPVHVQKGRWWSKFNAKYLDTGTKNNTITFSILDENGNPFSGKSSLNGTDDDISDIKENVVQLSATLNIGNSEETKPVLYSWEIEWTIENKKPEFDHNSIEPGQDGWINLDLKDISIDVRDIGVDEVISGLDVDSAKYELEYVAAGSEDVITKEYDAECDAEPGATTATVIAKISEIGIKVVDLRNITFSIKDLAGNENSSKKIQFKLDTGIPSSEILNASDFDETYNTPVRIKAEGTDADSGIASIALYYRGKEETNWTQNGSDQSPYEWDFEIENSSDYEFCTIAKDKAGNTEEFPEEGDVSFVFDKNIPYKPEFEDMPPFNSLPELSVTFADDYELQSVEYKLSFHGTEEWITIADDIGSDIYVGEWSLTQSDWDSDSMIEDGHYDMSFRVTDISGNQYETIDIDDVLVITKDVIPTITDTTIDTSDFEGGGWKETYTIKATLPDDETLSEDGYATLEYCYSSDNKDWCNWKQYGDELIDEPLEWKFKAKEGSGYYKFKVKIWENASSYVESEPEKVSITMFPTALVLMMIILVIILVLTTVVIVKKFKKKK